MKSFFFVFYSLLQWEYFEVRNVTFVFSTSLMPKNSGVMCKIQYSYFLLPDSPITVFPFVFTIFVQMAKSAKTFGGKSFFFEIVGSWQNLPGRVCLCEDQSPLLLRKNLWGKPLPWLDPIYHGHFDFEPSVFHIQWQHWNNKISWN